MSYRDTRIFICDVCGVQEEGRIIREKHPDGKLFFELPVGWKLFRIPNDATCCDECAAMFDEVKQKAKVGE